jgi:hypothetical protein
MVTASIWLHKQHFVCFTDSHNQNLNDGTTAVKETQKTEPVKSQFEIKLTKSDQELLKKLDMEHQEKLKKQEAETSRKQVTEKSPQMAASKLVATATLGQAAAIPKQVSASPNPKSKQKVPTSQTENPINPICFITNKRSFVWQ